MIVLLGVHVKTTNSRSPCNTPAFRILTLWVAQGSALDWLVPVYASKIHVLLVKTRKLLFTKLRKRALPNVHSVGEVWWGVPLCAKSVRTQVSYTLKTSLLMPLVVLLTMLMSATICLHNQQKLYHCPSLHELANVGIIYLPVLLC